MITLMIVDDEPQITSMLERWFEKSGEFNVKSFNDPELAFASLDVVNPDIVLLDIMMPQMDGITMLGKIKTTRPLSTVVMMTAYSTLERVLASHKKGSDGYILKPFESLSEVEERVKSAYFGKEK